MITKMLPAKWTDAVGQRHNVMIAAFGYDAAAVIILENGQLAEVPVADLQVDWHYDAESGIWMSDWEEVDDSAGEVDAEG